MTTPLHPTLWERIEAANAELAAGEPDNISTDSYSGYTGYAPQHLFDAMNKHVGPGNWSTSILEMLEYVGKAKDRDSGQIHDVPCFSARVAVTVWDDDGRMITREQWGGGRGDRDRSDGMKIAVTDATKKCLAIFSVGNKAYRGELEDAKSEKKSGGGRSGGGGGGSNPLAPWRARMIELGLLLENTETGKFDIQKPWWRICEGARLPTKFSQWTPEETARAMSALDDYAKNTGKTTAPPPEPDANGDLYDPFSEAN
jgi:hypothetical protein